MTWTIRTLPAIQETQVKSLGQEDPWKWQHTLVFLPGESHGQRGKVGCSPWGPKESEKTELLTLSLFNVLSTQWDPTCIFHNDWVLSALTMSDNPQTSSASFGLGMASLENRCFILPNCLCLVEIYRKVFISDLIKIFCSLFIYFKMFYKEAKISSVCDQNVTKETSAFDSIFCSQFW